MNNEAVSLISKKNNWKFSQWNFVLYTYLRFGLPFIGNLNTISYSPLLNSRVHNQLF